MVEMTNEMQNCFDTMDDCQKIRMFYELAKYINKNTDDVNEDGNPLDKDMENLFDDIANVVTDIENL